jgi:hypothetical protein
MADTLDPQGQKPKLTPEEQEARWQKMMQEVSDGPQDVDVLIRAGSLAEDTGRKAEAYLYFQKANRLDPEKRFLVARMRKLASTPEQQKEVEALARRPASFGKALDDVFAYPVRGSGIGILIVGAVFFFGLRVVAQFNIFPMISAVLLGMVGAYLAMFYVDVLNFTVTGSDDLPTWPDPARYREFLLDWSKIGVAYLVSFLPVILILGGLALYAHASAPDADGISEAQRKQLDEVMRQIQESPPPAAEAEGDKETPAPAARPAKRPVVLPAAPPPAASPVSRALLVVLLIPCGILVLLGFVYLPMAVLANCVYGHPLACVNPFFLVKSIGVARKDYGICILAYFGVAVAAGVLEVLTVMPGIFFFSSALATLVELYGGVVQMRILGIFYRMNQAKMRWMMD